jgi:hypothetical protein
MAASIDWFALVPKLLPLLPEIEKAVATAQRIIADPDVKAALATAAQVSTIVQQTERMS